MALRINAGIREELGQLHEAMEKDDKNDASYYAHELEDIIKAIDGEAVRLWRSETWQSEKRENPLKDIPDVTLLEAARLCQRNLEGKPPGKQWFTALDMDKALREVLTDSSWLPKFIDGRHWGVTLKRLENVRMLRRVPLVGRSGKASGHGYVVHHNYHRPNAGA